MASTLDFKWTADVFGTGNGHMDEEHVGLFNAIDALAEAKTPESFEAMAGLVIAHFADEEKECNLSDAHKKMHTDLLAVATAKLGELKSGAATVDDALVDYLKNWLMNHIKQTDQNAYGVK
jgi:hemerythrin-like metal-binding protein